ncbi:molybdate ABC transporter permease subunit [Pleionea sp. CnH1-48]|uniref:molybdate ABC transporter permease subunit n=1 Tax=Pleionea sp. CnH1-48 TaxID=2954494 RepID=UPI0020974CA5|nr:molybdate ABC transporter permease subunit [Pleionea sp. CnH1-48]MCO7224935.1 molybdate ABC transporter permease subunit [Pleionea sp. CnH1-48]
MLSEADWVAIGLTFKLATWVTGLLLVLGTPLAWWLARTQSWWKGPIAAVVAMPLVLPPTVLGFYLLMLMGPEGPVGQLMNSLGWQGLPFSFTGLVIASMIYSLPFVVQPLQNTFESLGRRPLEVAATLRAGPIDRFFSVVLPLSRRGYLTAAVLGFAHTIGEFGVVLMIGGNIPGTTQVIAVRIYDHVESLDYSQAYALSGFMVAFAFVVLVALYSFNRRHPSALSGFGRSK